MLKEPENAKGTVMLCIPIRMVVNECRVEIKQRHAAKNPGTLSRDTMGVGCGEIYDRSDSVRGVSQPREIALTC